MIKHYSIVLKLTFTFAFVLMLESSALYSQNKIWAAVPCDILAEDSTYEDYIDYFPIDDEDAVAPDVLNIKEIEKCLKQDLFVIKSEEDFGGSFDESELEEKNVTLFGVLIDPEGNVVKICQASFGKTPDDQFKSMSCLEKLRMSPGIEDGEKVHAVSFVVVGGPIVKDK